MAKFLPDKPKKNFIVVKKPKPESPFQKSQRIQLEYERVLRGIVKEIGKLIQGYAPTDILQVERLRTALRQYSEILGPWSLKIAEKILNQVDSQDKWAWRQHSKNMSKSLRDEILNAPIGDVFAQMMQEQVNLIKSLPLEAAERVHGLVTENLWQSARAEDIMKKILQTENITQNRARLIARTEIARAANKLTESRATYVGSTSYIWKTSKDLLVRKSHKEMHGKVVLWAEPPKLSDGTTTHAGCFPNCRCYSEPIIPGDN